MVSSKPMEIPRISGLLYDTLKGYGSLWTLLMVPSELSGEEMSVVSRAVSWG